MGELAEIQALLTEQPQPVCAELTPFELRAVDGAAGFVRVEFAPQPLFGNHFGHVQGGFAASMVDVVYSLAAFVRLRRWLPTVELKCSFLAPAQIGPIIGEGRVVRAGRSIVFVEAKLINPDGQPAVQASATMLNRPG